MKITVYSHNYLVTGHDHFRYPLLKEFAFRFAEYDNRGLNKPFRWGQPKPQPKLKKVYAAYTSNKREFRFHINTLDSFLALLKERDVEYEIEYVPMYEPSKIELKVLPKYIPREEQVPLIDYIVEPGITKVLNVRTGGGKTMMALTGASRIGNKVLISIESRFFNLWVETMEGEKQIIDVDLSKEVLFIRGSKELSSLLQAAKDNLLQDIKVFVISSRTIANYIEAYEKYNGELDGVYSVAPIDMYKVLDIGVRIKDEVHLSLYANFVEELYMHVPKSISLSATLEDGTFLDKILAIMFPKEWRSPDMDYLQYINVNALVYCFENPKRIKYTNRGSSDYSHNAFEDFIIKEQNGKVYNNYVKMIIDRVRHMYVNKKVDKQKACVFVSSVAMADKVHKSIQKAFPKLKVTRYAASSGDVYNEAKEGDILVTTVQSFGTGFDLPDLIYSLMTTALRSQKTNLQVLGRLRVLKNYPDTTPEFEYFVCSDIGKHVAYGQIKKQQFHGKVKAHGTKFINELV